MVLFKKLAVPVVLVLLLAGMLFAGKWWGSSVAESEANQAAINEALTDTTWKLNLEIEKLRQERIEPVIKIDTLIIDKERAREEVDLWVGEVEFTVETLVVHLEEQGDTIGVEIVGSLRDQLAQMQQAIVRLDLVNDSLQGAYRDLTLNMYQEFKLRDKKEEAFKVSIADLNTEIDNLQGELKVSFGKQIFRQARNAAIVIAVYEGARQVSGR